MNLPKKFLSIYLIALISCIILPPLAAQTVDTRVQLTGRWQGSIRLPGQELPIAVVFDRDEAGTLRGEIDIPSRELRNAALLNIRLIDSTISFFLPGSADHSTFVGTISSDVRSITGYFTEAGNISLFDLTRTDSPVVSRLSPEMKSVLGRLRDFIDSSMISWHVPGVAAVVVKEGKVIFSEGFGYRDLKDSLPVTSKTLFAIGSATKGFTTLAMGILVDHGKLEWDRRVKDYLPDFKMKDPFASERMTSRDLITHRSGLPRHEAVWYNSSASRKELVERLAHLEPNKDFRSAFQYQNLMYVAAGYLVEQVSGMHWEEFVSEKIFKPLGMTNSNFSVLQSRTYPDYAIPYVKEDTVVKEIPFRDLSNAGPAGSINSSIEDLSQWLMLHLGVSGIGDSGVVSTKTLKEIHSPQIVLDEQPEYSERLDVCYGLGWFIESYRGNRRIYHRGDIDGFTALLSFLPEKQIGIAVLTNLDKTPLPSIVAFYASDLLLDLQPIDWNGRFKTEAEQARKEGEKERASVERKFGTRPIHDLVDYSGEYENPGYGRLEVKFDGRSLTVIFNSIASPLEHWHYETFRAIEKGIGNQQFMFTFLTNPRGDVDRVTVPFEPLVPEIVFTRMPRPELSDRAFLSRLSGDYQLAGQVVRFILKADSSLVVLLPGQPQYELAPYRGNEFSIKGLAGYSVEFILNGKARAEKVLFKQPNGVFTAVRME